MWHWPSRTLWTKVKIGPKRSRTFCNLIRINSNQTHYLSPIHYTLQIITPNEIGMRYSERRRRLQIWFTKLNKFWTLRHSLAGDYTHLPWLRPIRPIVTPGAILCMTAIKWQSNVMHKYLWCRSRPVTNLHMWLFFMHAEASFLHHSHVERNKYEKCG